MGEVFVALKIAVLYSSQGSLFARGLRGPPARFQGSVFGRLRIPRARDRARNIVDLEFRNLNTTHHDLKSSLPAMRTTKSPLRQARAVFELQAT